MSRKRIRGSDSSEGFSAVFGDSLQSRQSLETRPCTKLRACTFHRFVHTVSTFQFLPTNLYYRSMGTVVVVSVRFHSHCPFLNKYYSLNYKTA